jgi:hypothetical protein
MTSEEAKALRLGTTLFHLTARNADGTALRARVNGAVKLWKRDPSRFSIPMKHGLRSHFYLTPENLDEWRLTDPTEKKEPVDLEL